VQADLTPIFRSVPTNNRTVSRKNMIAHFDCWTARAHAVPIECETERRGIELRGAVERVGPCPKCGGEDRFAIHTKKGVWNCRGCGVGGDVIKLVEHLDGINFIAACTALTGEPPPKADCGGSTCEPRKIAAAEFRYEDENGAMRLVVERIEFQNADGTYVLTKDGKRKKTFRQKRLDPDRVGRWLWNADGVPTLPYRLPELIEAIAAGLVILIVEGECKVDLLRSWNIPATCCAGGAKKWRFEHSAFLRGANAVILPDNDDAGRAHMNVVAASLQGAAATIRVLELPGLPPKGDIVDWAAAGGTAELLHRLIDGASHWRPAISSMGVADIANESAAKVMDEVDEDAVFERLAKLPPGVKLAREIKSAAKRLGISQDAINDELEVRRDEKANAPLHDHWIVEPWPEPIDSDSLLRDIMLRIRRHVVCSHDDALAISLWIMFAWVHDAVATHSPILNINSAEPESGKSTTLGLI
jgi:Zinc-binding domain of primase-helicase